MRQPAVLQLGDCTEFRQTLEARPPKIVHGTAILIVGLVSAAVAWAALTRADLVVRAAGRMRPTSAPQKVMATFRGEVLTGGAGAYVREVHFREGMFVKQGDILLRLDTERLDNEIKRMKRRVEVGEGELQKGREMADHLLEQFKSSRAKIEAELAQAQEQIRLAKERCLSEVRLAEAEFKYAEHDEAVVRTLVNKNVSVRADLDKAVLRTSEAREKLAQARIPIDEGKPEVLRRGLTSLSKDCRVKLAELGVKQDIKQGEIEADQLHLANLELERRQAVLRAPITGVVTTGDIRPGDTLELGKPVLEIAEQSGFRFEVAVPTGEMEDIQVGMPVRIRLDAYDYQRFGTLEGTVGYIAADSTVHPENGSAVYLVRVEVKNREVGRGELRGPVKLGLTGKAEILTGHETILSLLVRKIRRTISLG
jgi:multidrug resistance efflux pump